MRGCFFHVVWCVLCLAAPFGQCQGIALEDAKAYHALADEAHRQGDWQKARFLYERSAALNPEDPLVLNDLGLVNEMLGDPLSAEAQYLKAIALDFKCLPAYTNLGLLYRAQGRFEQAINCFENRIKYGKSTDKWTLLAQAAIAQMMQDSATLRQRQARQDREALENAMMLRSRERVRLLSRGKEISAEMEGQHD